MASGLTVRARHLVLLVAVVAFAALRNHIRRNHIRRRRRRRRLRPSIVVAHPPALRCCCAVLRCGRAGPSGHPTDSPPIHPTTTPARTPHTKLASGAHETRMCTAVCMPAHSSQHHRVVPQHRSALAIRRRRRRRPAPVDARYLALPPLPPARRALLVHSIVWAWRPNTARRVWPACRLEPLRTAAQHPHTPTHPTALHCTHARIHACHGPGPLCFRHRLTLARPWGPGKKDKGIDGREKRGRNAGTQARRHSLGWTPRPARDDGAGLNVLTTAAGSTARRGPPPSSGRRPTHTA